MNASFPTQPSQFQREYAELVDNIPKIESLLRFHKSRLCILSVEQLMKKEFFIPLAEKQLKFLEEIISQPPEELNSDAFISRAVKEISEIQPKALSTLKTLLESEREPFIYRNRILPLSEGRIARIVEDYRLITSQKISQINTSLKSCTNFEEIKKRCIKQLNVERSDPTKLGQRSDYLRDLIFKTEGAHSELIKKIKTLIQRMDPLELNIFSSISMGNMKYHEEQKKNWLGKLFTSEKQEKFFLVDGYDRKFSLSSTDEEGRNALHIASLYGHEKICSILLTTFGMVHSQTNTEGYQPIHLAAMKGHLEVVQLLLETGAEINAKGTFDRTPLHVAAFCGHLPVVLFLLEKGAAINARAGIKDYLTVPLIDAVRREHADVVSALTDETNPFTKNLDVNLANSHQDNAIRIAILGGRADLLAMVLSHSSWKVPDNASDPNHPQQLLQLNPSRNAACIKNALSRLASEKHLNSEILEKISEDLTQANESLIHDLKKIAEKVISCEMNNHPLIQSQFQSIDAQLQNLWQEASQSDLDYELNGFFMNLGKRVRALAGIGRADSPLQIGRYIQSTYNQFSQVLEDKTKWETHCFSNSCFNALTFLSQFLQRPDLFDAKPTKALDAIFKDGRMLFQESLQKLKEYRTQQMTSNAKKEAVKLCLEFGDDSLRVDEMIPFTTPFDLEHIENYSQLVSSFDAHVCFLKLLKKIEQEKSSCGFIVHCNGYSFAIAVIEKKGKTEYFVFDPHGSQRVTGHPHAFIACCEDLDDLSLFLTELIQPTLVHPYLINRLSFHLFRSAIPEQNATPGFLEGYARLVLPKLIPGERQSSLPLVGRNNLLELLLEDYTELYDEITIANMLKASELGKAAHVVPKLIKYAMASFSKKSGDLPPEMSLLEKPLVAFLPSNTTSSPVVAIFLPKIYEVPPSIVRQKKITNPQAQLLFLDSQRCSVNRPYVEQGGELTYWQFYNVLKILESGSEKCIEEGLSISDPEDENEEIDGSIQDYYRKKLGPFLNKFPPKTLSMSLDNTYPLPAHYIERLIALFGNPEQALRLYRYLYPFQKEVCSAIAKEICKTLVNKGLLVEQTENNFRLTMEIALYREGHLQQVLKAALQQKWILRIETPHLNLIHLIIPTTYAIESSLSCAEFIQDLTEFNPGNSPLLTKILDAQSSFIAEGMKSFSWYEKMRERLKLAQYFKTTSIASHAPFERATGTESISSSTVPDIQKIPPFPIKSLETLLKFSEELNVTEMLENAKKGDKTALFSFLQPFLGLDSSSPVYAILAGNLTFSKIWSIARSNLSMSNIVQSVFNGVDIAKPTEDTLGKFAKQAEALNTLKDYLIHFQPQEGPAACLNFEILAIVLLKDPCLYNFLNQDNVQNQLAELCGAAQIPKFTKKIAEQSIRAFASLQKIVIELPENEKIDSYKALSIHLAHYKLFDTLQLLEQLFPLFTHLNDVVQIYLKPQIICMELLAFPRIKDLLSVQPSSKDAPCRIFAILEDLSQRSFFDLSYPKRSFLDCKPLFENDKSGEMGIFLPTPIDGFIGSKRLDNYCFTHKNPEDPDTLTFNMSFKEKFFQDFSFQNTLFNDFTFEEVRFENCQFTNARFKGTIKFLNVYIDSNTASSFLLHLRESLLRGLCKLEGKIVLVESVEHKSTPQVIPEELKELIHIFDATWVIAYRLKKDDYQSIIEDPSPPLHSPEGGGEETQEASKSYLNSLWGGLGHVVGYGTEAATLLSQGLNDLYHNPSTFGLSVYSENQNTLTDYQTVEKTLEQLKFDLQKKQEELNQKVLELEKQSEKTFSIQQTMNEHLHTNQMELKTSLEEQSLILDNVSADLAKIQAERKVKELIAAEQKKLLENPCKGITLFYQTFLTDLTSILETIHLIQNPLNPLQHVTGKLTNLSNKEKKIGVLTDKLLNEPNFFKNTFQWMQDAASCVKDYGIEVAGIVKPLLSFVPYAGGALEAGAGVVQAINDQSKLKGTREITRGLTIKSIEKIADAIARKITFAYEEQITMLSESGAIRFAECGVLRFLVALLNGYIQPSNQFTVSALVAVRRIQVNQLLFGILDIPIGFTQKLELRNPKSRQTWSEDEFYRRPGISYCVSNKWHYYSNDKKLPGLKAPLGDKVITCASKIGYMKISEEEWRNFFMQTVTLDAIKRNTKSPINKVDLLSPNPAAQPSSPKIGTLSPHQNIHSMTAEQRTVFANKATQFVSLNLTVIRSGKKLSFTLKKGEDINPFARWIESAHRSVRNDFLIINDSHFEIEMKTQQDCIDLINALKGYGLMLTEKKQ